MHYFTFIYTQFQLPLYDSVILTKLLIVRELYRKNSSTKMLSLLM